MSLNNKIVLITGASAGIGEATAYAFAREGAHIIACARSESKLHTLKIKLEAQFAVKVHTLVLDVRDNMAVEHAITTLPPEWCDIDVLVNNAGLAAGLDKIQDGQFDDWERMIDTNIKGLLYVSHFVLKGMLARNRGHVINIGSTSSYSVYPGGVVYCATKFAVRAISEGMKMDVHESDIRITEIDPGLVNTEFSTVRFKGDKQRADSVYEGFEALKAEDIASSIVYVVKAPAHVNIRQMLVMPTAQTAAGMLRKKS